MQVERWCFRFTYKNIFTQNGHLGIWEWQNRRYFAAYEEMCSGLFASFMCSSFLFPVFLLTVKLIYSYWNICVKFEDLVCLHSSVCFSVHRFSVGVLPGTKLESGPATLHLCNNLLALARDVPPVIIGHWNLPELRRYGPVPNGFVFEGGTRCGYCKFIAA